MLIYTFSYLTTEDIMQRTSVRIDCKVVKGYVVDGCFYRTKKEAGLERSERKQHYTVPNPMYGLIDYAVMHDKELKDELQDAFTNFAGTPHRNGMPSISIKKLIELAHTQEVMYSTNHPDSPNHASYDAALTVLVYLIRGSIEDWREQYGWTMKALTGGVAELMLDLGYDISNSKGVAANSINVSIVNGRMLQGAEANASWLKSEGLTKLIR